MLLGLRRDEAVPRVMDDDSRVVIAGVKPFAIG